MRGYRFALFAGLAVAASAPSFAGAPQANKDAIKAHIAFLADDLLEGRAPGTPGYDIAANYVAAQFAQYGLTPKGDQGSYLQHFGLRSARGTVESASFELESAAGAEKFAYGTEFMIFPRAGDAVDSGSASLIFVGYGIRDKQLQYDDYSGVDVKGKIVVVLRGYPSKFPSEAGAHLSSGLEKRKLAQQMGALGMITLWTPQIEEKVLPFAKLKQYAMQPTMTWLDPAGKPFDNFPSMLNDPQLSLKGAKKLFARAGVNLDDIYAKAAANQPLPHKDLKLSARFGMSAARSDIRSSNVVGMIPGSDPQLKNEYVVFSAHLDHLGKVPEKEGDNIYNGAMDNASGVATMLEMARMFSQSGVKPKRSLLFIALTGEERGLLGSSYYASNPTVPAGTIVADVNLDMPLLTYDFSSVVPIGAEHSSLKDNVARATRQLGLTVQPDPEPEQTVFVRSDHYSFVKEGVPSISLDTGRSSFNKSEDANKVWDDFLEHHYHQPNDDMQQPFNFTAAARFAQLNYNIAADIANAKSRPTWNKGDFFGNLFKK